jgi:signal transduction histidine kinase
MTNSKVSQRSQRSQRLWLPLLLLAQFLTITPVLLIVFAGEQQKRASDRYLTLLDGLDRLSFEMAELESLDKPGEARRLQYSDYRGHLNGILSGSPPPPEVREALARVDSIVTRMEMEPGEAPAAAFREDGRAARSELLNAQRLVRSQLSTTGDGIAQRATYLKALVAGACLLAFGVVFMVRRFRVDVAIQSRLQGELRTTNEDVIAALASARSESDAKNRFLAHIGHLLQTPLNAIVDGTGELLLADLTGRQRDCAQTSLRLAESLAKVADQVLDYSRMESGSLQLESREFDPAAMVTDVVQDFIPLAERKGLKLRSSIKEGLPGVVKGDPRRLRQVLVNLLSNAVRFTEQGEIVLRVEEAAAGDERTFLRFEVRDTGIGITEQVRNCIFQPFSIFQPVNPAGAPATGVHQGAGLGLAISKKLVELMGGKIEISSEPARGSTFTFMAVFESFRAAPQPQSGFGQPALAAKNSIAGSGVGTLIAVNPAVNPYAQDEKKERRDRRAEGRHGVNYPTLLRAENAGVAVIRVLDVSKSGLRLSVPFRLLPRTEVEIRIEGTSVVGVVSNCVRISANEFHVGIKIPRQTTADEQERLNHLQMLRIELT